MADLAPGDPLLTAARVVVVDACSTLDVLRIPARPEWSADAMSVKGVLDLAGDASRLIVMTTAAVQVEFMAHRHSEAATVRRELRRCSEKLGDDTELVSNMFARCGLAPHPLDELSLEWFEDLGERFVTLTNAVCRATVVRPDDTDDVIPAWERVAVRRAPANRGSRSMADCVLCEAALRIARQRRSGTTGLLTSNKKDFRLAGSLHPDLVGAYGEAGLIDLPTWRDALTFARGITERPT